MRILHLHSGNIYGGIETVLVTLARTQREIPEIEHVFALSFDGLTANLLRQTGCAVHILGEVRASRPRSVRAARQRLSSLCNTASFDATLCHSTWSLALLSPAIRSPLVYYVHDLLNGRHWLDRWAAARRPDLLLSNSAFTRCNATRLFPGVPCKVLYPPIGNPAPSPTKQSSATITILQASRLEKWKGHGLLIDALSLLQSEPRWQLAIAGSSDTPASLKYRASLVTQATRLGIAHRIQWLGFSSDIPALMRSADIYCQPNLSPEPFGLTFVEALQAGTPVVTTDLGGPREILDPTCGVLCLPNHPRALADALLSLIHNSEFRARLGASGPARAALLCDARTQTRALADALRSVTRSAEAA